VVASKSKTTDLSRDQGRLGIGTTTSHRHGQEDERGNLHRGQEVSRSRSGGLAAGPGGVGVFGTASAHATQAHGGGLKTTQSIGADGQATVDVKPVPGTTPVQYRMTVIITLGGHASVGGSLERGRLGATGEASVQGSVTGVFEHTFSKEQVDTYLGALKDPSLGGAQQEFRIMRLAAKGSSLQEAKSMLAAQGLSPEAIKHMKEDDASEVTVQGGTELKGGLSGQGSVVGISLGASLSRSGSLRRHVTIKDGKALVTVEVLASKGVSGGAAVSLYGAEVGGGYGELESTGESVTFSADPNDAASLGRIAAVDSAETLRSLAASPGGAEVVSRTQSKEKTTMTTAKVGLLGAEAEIGSEHTYGERTITGPHGETKEFTGGSGGRLAAGVKGGPKVSYGEKDTVVMAGGPDNEGYGDVSTKITQTDAGKTARDAKKAPVRTAAGLATGGTPVLAEGEEVVGMKLSDADFNRLSAAAADNKAWTTAFVDSHSRSGQSLADMNRLAARVRAAQGDRKAIAQAFAQYAKDNDNAAKFVQELVRVRGQTEGGRRYDWPAEYAGEQSVYESLVLGDPGAEADRLATSGNVPGAVQSLQNAVTQLDTVANTVNNNRDRFSDKAAVTEMLRSIRRRQHDLNKKISELQPAPHPEAAKADPANKDPAKAEGPPEGAGSAAPPPAEAKAGPDPATVSRVTEELSRYITDCQKNRTDEQKKFAEVDSEYHHWYRGADPNAIFEILNELRDHVYPLWNKQIQEMKELYKELGQDPNQALQYGPDKAGWTQRRNTPEMRRGG
jgi:hypothetical protein